MCSELPIFPDDAQHCPDDMKKNAVYMISNGRGRVRGAEEWLGPCLQRARIYPAHSHKLTRLAAPRSARAAT